MAKILVADDEMRIRTMVAEYLEKMGHQVTQVPDGAGVLEQLSQQTFDLLVLDVMMPGIDGFSLIRQLKAPSSLPVLFMTARTEEADRVLGLELGADDYITKPFSLREMAARIGAVLRRSHGSLPTQGSENKHRILWKDLDVDPEAYRVRQAGRVLNLSTLQFQILLLFLRSPGRVFTRGQILETVTQSQLEAYERTVDVHVKNLRKILGDDAEFPRYIETVRGIGYRLVSE